MKKKKNTEEAEMEELKKIHEQAWREGIFIKEWTSPMGWLAAAGSVRSIVALERVLKMEIDINTLSLANCVCLLDTEPALCPTRTQASRDAVDAFKKHLATR